MKRERDPILVGYEQRPYLNDDAKYQTCATLCEYNQLKWDPEEKRTVRHRQKFEHHNR